jgi:hypothetical protein
VSRDRQNQRSIKGGVILEYLLLTLFTAIASVSLLGIAAHIFREKIEQFSQQAGVTLPQIKWNPFAAGEDK